LNERPYPPGSYVRGRDLEFDRALLFSDAVYAIALTLLVVGIAVPKLSGTPTVFPRVIRRRPARRPSQPARPAEARTYFSPGE